MWDVSKDYLNALLGAAFLLTSIILIPEVRKKRKYIVFVIFGIVVLTILGIDKINRDRRKDIANEKKAKDDLARINSLDSSLREINISYKSDTSRFSDFKKNLESDFHIRDSANKPVPVQIYNTQINKAENVKIGG